MAPLSEVSLGAVGAFRARAPESAGTRYGPDVPIRARSACIPCILKGADLRKHSVRLSGFA